MFFELMSDEGRRWNFASCLCLIDKLFVVVVRLPSMVPTIWYCT